MKGFVEKYKKRLSSMKQPLFSKNKQFRRNFSMIYFEKFLRIKSAANLHSFRIHYYLSFGEKTKSHFHRQIALKMAPKNNYDKGK
jgi:hypothetical protein